MSRVTESVVEDPALAWLEIVGYAATHGPESCRGKRGCQTLCELGRGTHE